MSRSFLLLAFCWICGCDDDPVSRVDAGVRILAAELQSVGSAPCGLPNAADGGVTLVANSAGRFRLRVEVEGPPIAAGDLRAHAQVLASGGTSRPEDTFVLLPNASGTTFTGSTELAVVGASRVVVRVEVAGLTQEVGATFASSPVALSGLSVAPAGVGPGFTATARVTCAGEAAGPARGVEVAFTAGPEVTLAAPSTRTDESGEAKVSGVLGPDAPATVVLRAAASGQSRECFYDGTTCD